MDERLVQWLCTEGGPAIRYRTAVELAGPEQAPERRQLLAALLRTERVQWLLKQLDSFRPLDRLDGRLLNTLHGSKPECLENVLARLIELGLHAGVSVFDSQMERFRQYLDNRLVRQALDDPQHAGVEGGRAVFVAIMAASNLLRGGYDHPEVLDFVTRRIGMLSHTALARASVIHRDQPELTGLPRRWAGKPIIRAEMDPTIGTRPLPLIYDFFALAYLPPGRLPAATQRLVDAIVSYGTSETYRSFPRGYGYLWQTPTQCYGCGWNLDLPDVRTSEPFEQALIVQRVELLARLPAARESNWLREAIQFLESFKTADGSYCLPRAYLVDSRSGYFVNGSYMGLEQSRRSSSAFSLESTFRMLLLHKLLKGDGAARD